MIIKMERTTGNVRLFSSLEYSEFQSKVGCVFLMVVLFEFRIGQ